jgi:hypothetical protein
MLFLICFIFPKPTREPSKYLVKERNYTSDIISVPRFWVCIIFLTF